MQNEISFTVRGYEMDSFGHVNNAVYVSYFEHGRWQMLKESGVHEYFDQNRLMLAVIESTVRYSKEAHVFDKLRLCSSAERKSPYLLFRQRLYHAGDGKVAAKATVKTLVLDSERVPQELPAPVVAALLGSN